ncbi:unnamed protein product [Notodromas monacha]|uniref:Transporter n=1 Tax=Notodromas monacha TaxID=399045 RepID=A0A7R9GBR0_9CRUS|nr:unnamed protein product [Notodromas monacha]CAG0916787.1 unnamed protein product [Notodromas monacha]
MNDLACPTRFTEVKLDEPSSSEASTTVTEVSTTGIGVDGSSNDTAVDEHHPERGTWSNPVEFFLTCLGYTVGLGNLWRFPYLAYANGGDMNDLACPTRFTEVKLDEPSSSEASTTVTEVSTTGIGVDGSSNDTAVDEHHPERGTWSNPVEFFLTCLGYTVGLGNLWRFPYLAYANGGGAFLIPYVTMLVFTGLPLYGLELCLGQYASLGANKLFGKMLPLFQGLGYAVLVVAFYTSIYYNVIIAWTVFYLFASFQREVPWKNCDGDFNTPGCYNRQMDEKCHSISSNMTFWNGTCTTVADLCKNSLNTCYRVGDETTTCAKRLQAAWNSTHCLNVTAKDEGDTDPYLFVPLKFAYERVSASEEYFTNFMLAKTDSWDDFGGLKWDLVLCSALAWVLVAAALIKGVQSSGKVVYFTALFPYFSFIGGLKWDLVLCSALAWVLVAAALIKGVQSSGKVVYFTALFPYVVLLIFGIKGATLPGSLEGVKYFVTPKWELLKSPRVWVDAATQNFYSLGPAFGGLITFSSYNKFNHNCMRLLTWAPLWGVLFFSMLMVCGFDSEFTMIETLVTALLDEKPKLRRYKGWVALVVSIIGFLLGLSMCTRGGIYMFTLFDYYSAGWAVLLLGAVEALIVVYVYGYKRFMDNVKEMMPRVFPFEGYWKFTLSFSSPVLIVGMVIATWVQYEQPSYGGAPFPVWADVLGWLMGISPLVVLVGFGIRKVLQAKKNGTDLRSLVKPKHDWGPAHFRESLQGTPKPALTEKVSTDSTCSRLRDYVRSTRKLRHTLTNTTIVE